MPRAIVAKKSSWVPYEEWKKRNPTKSRFGGRGVRGDVGRSAAIDRVAAFFWEEDPKASCEAVDESSEECYFGWVAKHSFIFESNRGGECYGYPSGTEGWNIDDDNSSCYVGDSEGAV
jgi:hypothetical protein